MVTAVHWLARMSSIHRNLNDAMVEDEIGNIRAQILGRWKAIQVL